MVKKWQNLINVLCEQPIMYDSQLTAKFEFSCIQNWVRLLFWFFVRKKTEFLNEKHWLSWIKNWEGQFLKRWTQNDIKRKFKFCCMLRIIHKRFFHRVTFKNIFQILKLKLQGFGQPKSRLLQQWIENWN